LSLVAIRDGELLVGLAAATVEGLPAAFSLFEEARHVEQVFLGRRCVGARADVAFFLAGGGVVDVGLIDGRLDFDDRLFEFVADLQVGATAAATALLAGDEGAKQAQAKYDQASSLQHAKILHALAAARAVMGHRVKPLAGV